jgi:hypothetical protein
MIKLKDNPIEGIEISMGGQAMIVPALNIKQHKALKDEIKTMENKDDTVAQFTATTKVVHQALTRNYPEITLDEVEEMLDMGNFVKVSFAAMGQKVPENLGEFLPAMLASQFGK